MQRHVSPGNYHTHCHPTCFLTRDIFKVMGGHPFPVHVIGRDSLYPLLQTIAVFCGTKMLLVRCCLPRLSLGQLFSGCLCSPLYLISFDCLRISRDAKALHFLVAIRAVVMLVSLELAWYPVSSEEFIRWSAVIFNFGISRNVFRAHVTCMLMAAAASGLGAIWAIHSEVASKQQPYKKAHGYGAIQLPPVKRSSAQGMPAEYPRFPPGIDSSVVKPRKPGCAAGNLV